ncbi:MULTISPECIES: glutamate--tRNA ligase [Mesorhizobium]|uniref:Glutamate--tRNA ligase n=2 Tax=Mesorhizobium TaxID=68287 RepID=A0A1A5HXP5_RHILI|nr:MULTISPECIES: glutamate--tRNA ligase [Mesorhizobium]MBE1711486.1 glutamate--tRNA ligase [Mesorhizobium japonicum]MBE1716304.1 glutamate--tRNA ligase [Mesorhizobium japonicum]MUT24132.1 glutamate--tRNA ligase [Mesorhizobium japonicum]MUT30923.1 glutamate--tRNA ligase [Mesorhizobium japonicum]OBP71759.1 glutamate--tRNA ligase [Mesorhizobium loti]
MTVTVRFAPSPTGRIHIGNARTALFNWLFALNNKGRFIQRFDDTDIGRSKQEFADAILYDLHWLGIFPDATEYQSRRFEVYDAAVERLKAAGVLYACYETPEELDLRRKVRRTRGLPPVYGREALALTHEQVAEYQADGRRPHWRFLLPNFTGDPLQPERTEVHWNDLVRGEETVDLASLSDPVLVREDGTYLYTLPSVVDDIEMGVSHVIRGDDHVTNTGVQIALFNALGTEPPVFGHHNLLTTVSGEGLSKRTGALSIESLREDGIEPMAVASLAVLVGTSENVAAAHDLTELAGHFDPAATSKSSAKFDPDELFVLNRVLMHHMPFDEACDRLMVLGISGEQAEPFWLAVRGNLDRLADAVGWWRILREGPQDRPEFSDDDRDFLGQAFEVLPEEPWNGTVWKDWTGKIREATGRKGKGLFMPLRLALTGRPSGPELADLLPLMGREGTLARRP